MEEIVCCMNFYDWYSTLKGLNSIINSYITCFNKKTLEKFPTIIVLETEFNLFIFRVKLFVFKD